MKAVRSCQAEVPASATALEPSADRIIVILADTITSADVEKVKQEVSARFRGLGKGFEFRLAVLRGSELKVSDPIGNPARLALELKDALLIPASDAALDIPLFYSSLAGVVRPSIPPSASVVLLGRLPALDKSLEDFAVVYLSQVFLTQKLRVGYRDISTGGDPTAKNPVLDQVMQLTGGAEPGAGIKMAEISWKQPILSHGFRLCTASIVSTSGTNILSFPNAEMEAGVTLPDISRYATFLDLKTGASKSADVRNSLDIALAINPGDAEVLRAEADLAKEKKDSKSAIGFLQRLLEVDSANGKLYLEYGHELFLQHDVAGAEKALTEGRKLKATSQDASEDLARIYFDKKDFPSALAMADESLAQKPKDQALLFIRADSLAAANNWEAQADSLEKALALGGTFPDREKSLIELYLTHDQPAKAAPHIDGQGKALPADPALNATWAGFLEKLGRLDEAIEMWRKVINLDPRREAAHEALARLLLEKGGLPDALAAAEAGLMAFPQSARIALLQANCLERLGQNFLARQVLAKLAANSTDIALIQHLAELDDRFGASAVPSYLKFSGALEAAGNQRELLTQVLERGLISSLREADLEKAILFEKKLFSNGRTLEVTTPVRATSEKILLPGGKDALAFIARAKRVSLPEKFMAEYCRAVLNGVGGGDPNARAYLDTIRGYFQKLSFIMAEGELKELHTIVTLSLDEKTGRKRIDAVLTQLGWRLRGTGKQATIESLDKIPAAKRQDVAGALGIDPARMQEAFQNGKPFVIDIAWDQIPLVQKESEWQATFYPKAKYIGGIAEAIANNPNVARAYLGLSSVDTATAKALIAAVGFLPLGEQYGQLASRYSAALNVSNGKVALPGGPSTEAAWTKLAGTSPSDANAFIKTLFGKDEGRLLQFFSALAELDPRHQRFATLNSDRLGRLYEVFAPLEDAAKTQPQHRIAFNDFMRCLTLNPEGAVDFPGSAEIWRAPSAGSKATGKPARTTPANVEDEIVVRLAKARAPELESFQAVVQIDRQHKLDESTALLLAQKYAQFAGTYRYFGILTGLSGVDLERIWAAAEHIKGRDPADLNQSAGQFHSALELVSLAIRAGTLRQEDAATILARFCDGFARAGSSAEYSAASLGLLRDLAASGPKGANPDDAIRAVLLGSAATKERAADFQKLLDQQKASSVQTLLTIAASAGKELEQELRLTMSGLVYAYYLRPADLLVSEDSQLLRKHQFVDPASASRDIFRESDLVSSTEKASSYLVGGFANFAATAGKVALYGASKTDPVGQLIMSTMIGSLRATNWSQYRDSDQELVGLKIRLGKEWCVVAAIQPAVKEALAADSMGLLSLHRRRELLSAIDARDWNAVWATTTLSDFYFLGERFLNRYTQDPWKSPLPEALRRRIAAKEIGHAGILAEDLALVELPPYEEYERQNLTARLASRVAEFKLYLADYFNRAGLPVQALSQVAEQSARRQLGEVPPAELRDWTAVLAAYSKLDKKSVDTLIP